MKPFVAVVLGLVLAAPAPADDTTKKLVGAWEITKSSGDAPVGTVVEFTDGGLVKVLIKDPELKIEGKYTVDKDKLTMELKAGDMDVKEVLTIKKLDADALELEDKDKKVDVLKKKAK